MAELLAFLRKNRFSVISWAVTFVLVAGMLLGALKWKASTSLPSALAPIPTAGPNKKPVKVSMPALAKPEAVTSIERQIEIKTDIPADKPRYSVEEYRVARGDSIFAIAKTYKLKPETVLWANYDILQDTPDSLRPGQLLKIPPTDGIYYQWKESDTLESVAKEFKTTVDQIVNYPGNNIDLTDPKIESGSWMMLPGGERETVQWLEPTIPRGASGTSPTHQNACAGGAVGSGAFTWPTGNHFLSGNDYWSGHLGIDIAAGEGAPVYAADSGVVTVAGWSNYGYGNMIQIDHGNGYSTLYAHLSAIFVSVCQSVSRGAQIGNAGNTGNSEGAHLHFEVRMGGGNINPWYVLP
jgi:murein DD-endopeptidase MepM/ murein hydrolase activator NlpD